MANSNENTFFTIERDLKLFLSNTLQSDNVETRLMHALKDNSQVQKKMIDYARIINKLFPEKIENNKKVELTKVDSNESYFLKNPYFEKFYELRNNKFLSNQKNLIDNFEKSSNELKTLVSQSNESSLLFKTENEKLQKKCSDLESKVINIEKVSNSQIDELKEKLKQLENNNKSNDNRFKKNESNFENYTTKNDDELKNKFNQIEKKLENQLKNLEIKLTDNDVNLDNKISLINENFEKEKKAKNESLNSIKINVNDLEKYIQSKLDVFENTWKQNINSCINESQNNYKEIKNNYLTNNQYNDNIRKIESEFNNCIKDIQNKEKTLENNISDLSRQMKEIETNITNNYLRTNNFNSKNEEFSIRISDLFEDLKNFKVQNDKIKKNNEELFKEMQNKEMTLENNISNFSRQIQQIETNLTNNYLKTSIFNSKNEDFIKTISDLSEGFNNLKSQNEKIKINLEELIQQSNYDSQKNLELNSKEIRKITDELYNRVNEINNKLEENTYFFLKLNDLNKEKMKIQNEMDQKLGEINECTSNIQSKLTNINSKVSDLDTKCLKSEYFESEKLAIIKLFDSKVITLKKENEDKLATLKSEINSSISSSNNINTNLINKTKDEFYIKINEINKELQTKLDNTDKKFNVLSQNLEESKTNLDGITKNCISSSKFNEEIKNVKFSFENKFKEIKNLLGNEEKNNLKNSNQLNELENKIKNNYVQISAFNENSNKLSKDLNESKQTLYSFISQNDKFKEDLKIQLEKCEINIQSNSKNITKNHEMSNNSIDEKDKIIKALNKSLNDLTSKVNENLKTLENKLTSSEEKFHKHVNDFNDHLNNYVKSNDYNKDKSYLEKNIKKSIDDYKDLSNTIKSDLLSKLLITINGGNLLKDYSSLLEQILGHSKHLINLYIASKNNYSSYSFHEAARNRSNLLVIIKTNNNCLFGFYTSKTFDPQGSYHKKYISDKNAFIFTLMVNNNKMIEKYPIDINNYQSAIFTDDNIFFALGEGYDLYIPNNCNQENSNANFPNTYMNFNSQGKNIFVSGAEQFKIVDLELYYINN